MKYLSSYGDIIGTTFLGQGSWKVIQYIHNIVFDDMKIVSMTVKEKNFFFETLFDLNDDELDSFYIKFNIKKKLK